MKPEQALELGQIIGSARVAHGLSPTRLAELSGVHRTSVMRLERGEFASTAPETLYKIANALNLNLAELYVLAKIPVPTPELPAFALYLRSRYDTLPDETVAQIERYASRIARKHGVDLEGPTHGEDEAPEP